MKIKLAHKFEDIISTDNILEAWIEFRRGKTGKKDVQLFARNLMDNIFELNQELADFRYNHGIYEKFNIFDPKPRIIHKSSVRDRLLHHAVYRKLYPFFDKVFVSDSYSCRVDKGTHKAVERFRKFARKASQNNTKTCWILQCDIKKFFANIDHDILINILKDRIEDQDVIWLLKKIIESFNSGVPGVGLPLGNLTSQLFINIYMNEFDQFVKHELKAKYYIRYADDFLILSDNKALLIEILGQMKIFLGTKLKLELHPKKVKIRTLASGIDFLGWVNFFDHRILRTKTKRRMLKQMNISPVPETLNSYFGLMTHGNTAKLRQNLDLEWEGQIRGGFWGE